MQFTSKVWPGLIKAVSESIEKNAEEVTTLDQVLGDGDHVTNLQRGIEALNQQSTDLTQLQFPQALQKTGMILLTTMGGASGSLFGTLFISMSKAAKDRATIEQQDFSDIFTEGVEAVKKRGKADAGEKTMLDVLIPVAEYMNQGTENGCAGAEYLDNIVLTAEKGMESTRDMLATKGRASYMGDKSIGHIDAGARTSQLIICAVINVLKE